MLCFMTGLPSVLSYEMRLGLYCLPPARPSGGTVRQARNTAQLTESANKDRYDSCLIIRTEDEHKIQQINKYVTRRKNISKYKTLMP
jgi:hypothetical protein